MSCADCETLKANLAQLDLNLLAIANPSRVDESAYAGRKVRFSGAEGGEIRRQIRDTKDALADCGCDPKYKRSGAIRVVL